MRKLFATALLALTVSIGHASEDMVYTFSVVPQQASSKLAKQWLPLLREVSRISGIRLRFVTSKDIPTFETELSAGKHDFSYMNPYHYVVYHEMQGYNALNKAKDKKIKGIIVVHRDSDISGLEELSGQDIAFPSPAAFAASILPRANLSKLGIEFTPRYVSSHDSVYSNVARQHFIAGGGIVRTLKATDPDARENLRILWTSPGYTPHAIANHPRVTADVAEKVQAALEAIGASDSGLQILQRLKITGWEKAQDKDWDDIRSLNINVIK
jgi:phosphonate transport system substrate-binding protein